MPLDAERVADALLDEIAPVIDALRAQVKALESRLVVAEARAPAKGADGIGLAGAVIDRSGHLVITTSAGQAIDLGNVLPRDGEDVDPAVVEALVAERVAAAVAALPPAKNGEPGKDADTAAILAALRAEIADAVSEEAFERRVAAEVGRRVDLKALAAEAAALVPKPKDGEPGTSVEPAEVERMVAAALERREAAIVEKVLAGIPRPKDGEPGKSVDPAEVKAMVAQAVGEQADTLPSAVGAAVNAEFERRAQGLVDRAAALVPAGKDADPDVTRALVEAAVKTAVEALPRPRDGEDAKPEAITAAVVAEFEQRAGELAKEAAALVPVPAPGRDADPAETRALVEAEVAKAVAALPKPKDGDPGRDASAEDIAAAVAAEFERRTAELIRRTAAEVPPGKDADPEEVGRLVDAAVRRAVEALPKPKNGEPGRDADPAAIAKMVDDAVARLPKPKDGVGLAGTFIGRDGELVVTLSDGSTKALGPVVGRDADMKALEALILAKVAEIPRPKDGADGLGFDDLRVEHDGERGFKLLFEKGDRVKEFAFTLPVILDRGVYVAGRGYAQGDGVSFGGSYWIAQKATAAKPGESDDWRLAVKRGRDGKPAEPVKI